MVFIPLPATKNRPRGDRQPHQVHERPSPSLQPSDAAGPIGTGTTPGPDYLSVRHDHTAKHPDTPDNPPSPLSGNDKVHGFLSSGCRGNVAFCDGHADYVTRAHVHAVALRNWDPAQ